MKDMVVRLAWPLILVDTGSDAFHRPAAPPTVPDGIQEHSASKTPYQKSKSAWSIHLITNLQVDLDVPLDGVEPLSTPMHDLQVAEDEAMVHNREKDVAATRSRSRSWRTVRRCSSFNE
jgi:hypothetical protein